MRQYIDMLREIGFTEYEAKAYIALLTLGEASAKDIAAISKVPHPKLYEVLNRLEDKGLIFSVYGRPVKYIARDPEESLLSIKARYDKIFDRLIKDLKELSKNRISLGKITLVRDINGTVRKIRSILNNALTYLRISVDDCSIWIDYGLIDSLAQAYNKGVDIKVVASSRCTETTDFIEVIGRDSFRVSDKANFLCIIRDGEEVLKGVTGREPIVIIYNIPEIVKLIEDMFNIIWGG